jgi:hypothetical protein
MDASVHGVTAVTKSRKSNGQRASTYEKTPAWYPWHPLIWSANQRVQRCGLAARGLWREMIDIAHQSTVPGEVWIAGQPATAEDIALVIRRPVAEVAAALAELEQHKVFDRGARGVIVCRRIKRQLKLKQQQREWGKLGGNPALAEGGKNVRPAQLMGLISEAQTQPEKASTMASLQSLYAPANPPKTAKKVPSLKGSHIPESESESEDREASASLIAPATAVAECESESEHTFAQSAQTRRDAPPGQATLPGIDAEQAEADLYVRRLAAAKGQVTAAITAGFLAFWAAYPRKVSKPKAKLAFEKAVRVDLKPADLVGADARIARIMDALRRHPFSPDPQYRPYPATWLNNARWLDEPEKRALPSNVTTLVRGQPFPRLGPGAL